MATGDRCGQARIQPVTYFSHAASGQAAERSPGAGNAATTCAANALLALGCYWDRTHRLNVVAGRWLAISRDGRGGVTAAASPAGLHAQLVQQGGYVPPLASPGNHGMPAADTAAARYARRPAETPS